MISLNFISSRSYAKEDTPSLELLELLGQFEKKDESWFDNELKLDNELEVEPNVNSTMNNRRQKTDKSRPSESINE